MDTLIKKLVVSIKKSSKFSEYKNSYITDPKNTIIKISKEFGEPAAKILEEEFMKEFDFKVNENDLADSLNKYFNNSTGLIFSFIQKEWSEITYENSGKNLSNFESI